MKHGLYLFLVVFISSGKFSAQELARSASFGAAVLNLNDSVKTALKLNSTEGTLIRQVVPNSSAQKAGFQAQDVLVLMDNTKINNTAHFLELLKTRHGGDKVNIGYYRNGKLKTVNMTLLPKPMEKSDDYEIIYSSVVSGKNHLRTIITKPKTGNNFPAVLIIGGVGCYSIDNPSAPEIQSIKIWSDSLTRNGFVTMRVEKPGMGDSRGQSCDDCDFNAEKDGFLQGLKSLRALPYVNNKNVFIAGFSMGGVIGPVIAQQEDVKGIIVYGTAGRNWLEYEIDNSYRQQLLDGARADSIDKFMRAEYVRLYGLLVEKKSPDQMLREYPELKTHLLNYPMRIEYFQQVADLNIRSVWMNTKSRVLALHGSSDFVSSGKEHENIATIVNQYHPGNGTYKEIANADHWGLYAESELDSFSQRQSGLNSLPLRTSIEWLKDNL